MKVWQKALHREAWHRWFAWHPVKAGQHLILLQWIERCRCYALIDQWWELRRPGPHQTGRAMAMRQTRMDQHKTLAVCLPANHAMGEDHPRIHFPMPQGGNPAGQVRRPSPMHQANRAQCPRWPEH